MNKQYQVTINGEAYGVITAENIKEAQEKANKSVAVFIDVKEVEG